MNELIVKEQKDTITSLELVEQINIFRVQEGNRKALQHKDLLKVIRDEFEEEINGGKISPVEYKDKKGELRPMFELTLNQAKQVSLRESKFVRKAMIHYIEELENKLKYGGINMNELVTKEYLGNNIDFKMVDGHVYANANKMAEVFGGNKKLENWKASPNTKRYIDALANSLKSSELKLVESVEGKYGGTWIHEKLILNFARYLNVEFELWCDEQIATLLREGGVALNKKDSLLLNIIKANSDSQRAIALNTYEMEYVKPLENTIKEQQPKVEYHDKVLSSESCYTTTQIAKELEMSARQLNIMLNHMGVQFKQSGQWMLTAKYQDNGYTKIRTHLLPNGDTKHSTVWTEKGRKFLLDLSEDF